METYFVFLILLINFIIKTHYFDKGVIKKDNYKKETEKNASSLTQLFSKEETKHLKVSTLESFVD